MIQDTPRCVVCSTDLAGRRKDIRYCSRNCQRVESWKRKKARLYGDRECACAQCGTTMRPGDGKSHTYCSPGCKAAAARARINAKNRAKAAERRGVDTRTCCGCGVSIAGHHPNSTYCTKECRREHTAEAIKQLQRENHRHRMMHDPEYRERRRTQQREKRRQPSTRQLSDTMGAARQREARAARPEVARETLRRYVVRFHGCDLLSVTERDLLRLVARFDGMCAYCRRRPYSDIDHVTPISRGGRHAIGNLMPACRQCNSSKNAKLLVQWRAFGGYDHDGILKVC